MIFNQCKAFHHCIAHLLIFFSKFDEKKKVTVMFICQYSPSIDIFFPSSMERKKPLPCLSVAAAFALSGL